MVAGHRVDRRRDQVRERRLEALVRAPEEAALLGGHARRTRVDALVDGEHLGVDGIVVQHRQAPVLRDPLDVVEVGRLVHERPDREARHSRHGDHEQRRRQLDRDERAQAHAQRSKKSRTLSAIQSTISPVSPGWQPTHIDDSVTRSAPSRRPATRCSRS